MQVTITAVNTTQAPKGYQVAEIKYLREGKEETRKLMSFVDESVFKQATSLSGFPIEANIVMRKELNKKDGKEYWNWKGIETNNTEAKTDNGNKVTGHTGKVLGSNYETPAERAARQVYITRIASVNTAIAFFSAQNPKGTQASVDEVLDLAKRLEHYVFSVDEVTNLKEPV